MAGPAPIPFSRLLRQLRVAAGLTQEELAEAAGLSTRSVSDLERGVNLTARRETARLLASALELTGTAAAGFVLAARGKSPDAGRGVAHGGPAAGVAAASNTLPRDIASLTGRKPELERLIAMVREATRTGGAPGIYAISGMAGIGKSAFAIHAAHVLSPQFPDGQIFLALHGHTPGQQPVDPDEALASLLQSAGVAAESVPQGIDARARLWRSYLAGKRVLLVLDDATSHAQVRPLLPGTAGSLLLVTSRSRLTALEDATSISLDVLSPDDAVDLLVHVSRNPDLAPVDPAVAQIAKLCGYLPLAVGILGRQLHHHPGWTAADLAADLAAARDRLQLMIAEDLSVAAALELSYRDLHPDQQQLFRRLGLYPGFEIGTAAAAALNDSDLAVTRPHLEALYDQNLISEPSHGRYRMHDLLQQHARVLASAESDTENEAAIDRLLEHYVHAAQSASEYFARWQVIGERDRHDSCPADARHFDSWESAAAWLTLELPNLLAITEYADSHHRERASVALSAALHGFLRRYGQFDRALSIHGIALRAARRDGDRVAEAFALTALGDTYRLIGRYQAAVQSLSQAAGLWREVGNRQGEADALNELAAAHYFSDDLPAAFDELARALELYRQLGHRLGEAHALNHLGALQQLADDYAAAIISQTQAIGMYRQLGYSLGEANAATELGEVQRLAGSNEAASSSLIRSLELARDLGYRAGEVNALIELGAAQAAVGEYPESTGNLVSALEKSKSLGYSVGEAATLYHLGLAQAGVGDRAESLTTLNAALALYRELGEMLGVARALNGLGEASPAGDAGEFHAEALAVASGIGSPTERARALEGLARCHQEFGDSGQARELLEKALEIYSGISSPHLSEVQARLRQYQD